MIFDNICPTAAGLTQQWCNKPVMAKERVLFLCQSVSLSVYMSLYLSVFLSVCMSFCLSVCPRSSAQLATSRRTCSGEEPDTDWLARHSHNMEWRNIHSQNTERIARNSYNTEWIERYSYNTELMDRHVQH